MTPHELREHPSSGDFPFGIGVSTPPRVIRSYQKLAIDLTRESLRRGNRRAMLQLPVGAGKTVIAAEIVRMAREKGKRVLFCVDSISLIDQTVERFAENGLTDIGVIQAAHERTDWTRPIQIASVQTLNRRMAPEFDFAIIDEAHRQSKRVYELMDDDPQRIFIGLSATPWSKGLGLRYQDLIIPVRMQELIDQGYLCGFQVYAPSHPDLRGVKVTAGDYNEADLANVMGDQSLVADVVETWKQRARGRPTLCFCVDREHAKAMQLRFQQAGIGCGYIDALTPRSERKEIEQQLDNCSIDVVCNVGCLTTGVDWSVGAIILARPTKSPALMVQMIGRGLRVNTGRASGDAIVLDHTDSVLRLGFPTDIHRQTLCSARKEDRQADRSLQAPTPRECPACHRLTTKRCICGYEAPKATASAVAEGAGDLIALAGGRSTEQRVKTKKPEPKDKAAFFAELRYYAGMHDKSEGWVLATFRNRFDEWPARKNGVVPIPPTQETLSWLTSQRIRWAKSKRSQHAGVAA